MLFFLKLLLGHIIGDFVLQPKSWVEKRKTQVGYLILHIAVHGLVLTLLFFQDIATQWPIIVFIVCAHLIIDCFKIWMEKLWGTKPFRVFFIDQFLHLSTLLLITLYQYELPDTWVPLLFSAQTVLYVIAVLLTVCVSPIVLRIFFNRWQSEIEFSQKSAASLVDAGFMIGIMERLLIVLFIQVGFLSGIGFLLATKSIFRFGDLANAKDTKFTEYVLLGTLLSFVVGISIGYGLLIGLRMVS